MFQWDNCHRLHIQITIICSCRKQTMSFNVKMCSEGQRWHRLTSSAKIDCRKNENAKFNENKKIFDFERVRRTPAAASFDHFVFSKFSRAENPILNFKKDRNEREFLMFSKRTNFSSFSLLFKSTIFFFFRFASIESHVGRSEEVAWSIAICNSICVDRLPHKITCVPRLFVRRMKAKQRCNKMKYQKEKRIRKRIINAIFEEEINKWISSLFVWFIAVCVEQSA